MLDSNIAKSKGGSSFYFQRVRSCGLVVSVGAEVEDVVARTFDLLQSGLPLLVTFVNPYSAYIAVHDPSYCDLFDRFDVILADGIGVVWGVRVVTGHRIARVSFDSSSLAVPIFRRCQHEGKRIMLIGGRPGIAASAARQLIRAMPGLLIVATMHGYLAFHEYDTAVRSARPDVLICGIGAPRQERLLIHLRDAGAWSGVGFTCGGYFDQLQGGLEYYPTWIDRTNLRWAYRLAREPRRLSHRYAIEYLAYARGVMLEILRKLTKYVLQSTRP